MAGEQSDTNKARGGFDDRVDAIVAQHARDIIILTDINGSGVWANPAFTAQTGYTVAELVGTQPSALLSGPDTDPETVTRIRAAVRAGSAIQVEIQYYKKTGEPFWNDLHIDPVRDDTGRLQGFVGVQREITEKYVLQKTLERKTAMLEAMGRVARVGAWEVNVDTNTVTWSDQAALIFGLDPSDTITADQAMAFFEGEGETRIRAAMDRALDTGHGFDLELPLRTVGGERVWAHVIGTPHYEERRLARIVGVIQDVTERHNREAQIRQAERAARAADRAKTTFLTNMSHELRTPMNGIIGMLRALEHSDLAPNQRPAIDTALSSAQALLGMLNDVLELSTLETADFAFDDQSFDPNTLLKDVAALLQPQAQAKGLVLSVRAPRAQAGLRRGDPGRIRQVLMKLVDNAVKFTMTGSVTLGVEPGARGVRFEVADTGPGIAPERQASIFDRFAQGDDTSTRRYGGAGLGLAIAREYVERMGGAIRVESEPGAGARFMVDLPLTPARDPQTGSTASNVGALQANLPKSLRVLIVEDNLVNQKVARIILERFGCETLFAGDGREALEALSELSVDLVLMDIQMPRMDGVAALRALRLDPSLSETPVAAVTANAMHGDRERYLSEGFDAYVSKPIQPDALANAIQTALDKRAKSSHPSQTGEATNGA
ncbi:MAG: PAS domain-containing protein [Maricaulaceae bacterium]